MSPASIVELLASIGALALRGAEYAIGAAERRARLLDERSRARAEMYRQEREAIERIRRERERLAAVEREVYGAP